MQNYTIVIIQRKLVGEEEFREGIRQTSEPMELYNNIIIIINGKN